MVGFSNATTCALLLHLVIFFFYLPTPAVSLSFDYPTFSKADQNDIKIEGGASFSASSIDILGNSGSTDGDSYGRALYNATPVQLWDKAIGEVVSFTTRFSFAFSGDNSSKGGMAFFLAGYPSSLPDNCPNEIPVRVDCPAYKLSLTNQSTDAVASGDSRFVAVEFGTFNTTVVSDPDKTYDHIGIDVNSLRSVKTEVLPRSSLIGNLNAVIEYDSVSSNLTVALWLGDDADGYPGGESYNLTYKVDLKSALPEQVSIGFSAAMSNSISLQPPNSISLQPPSPPTDDDGFQNRHIGLGSWYFNSSFEPRPAPPPSPHSPPAPGSRVIAGPPPAPHSPPAPGSGVIAGAVVGATMFLVLLFAAVVTLVVRRRHRKILDTKEDYTDSEGESEPMTEIEMGTAPRRFPYHELVDATRSFAAEEKLGQGGFGAVYRGYLRELGGLAVAIKRLQSSTQGMKEYKSEIKVISRLRHRNLVQLIGWCHGRDQELLLVYELMPNRSLDIHLHGKQGKFLTWPMRMKILLELGSALLYLHEEWEQCVLHRDIKPSNVMLDESFGAKLGDFGLARLVDHAAGMQTMTAISGTPGYLDPECVNTGRASAESDVYSFGVVLLEVACGRRPMSITAAGQDKQKNGEVFRLVEWAWGLYGQGVMRPPTSG